MQCSHTQNYLQKGWGTRTPELSICRHMRGWRRQSRRLFDATTTAAPAKRSASSTTATATTTAESVYTLTTAADIYDAVTTAADIYDAVLREIE